VKRTEIKKKKHRDTKAQGDERYKIILELTAFRSDRR
jgi:hypothetical protein